MFPKSLLKILEKNPLDGFIKEIEVSGWVKATRSGKFVKISDGSSLETLQLVFSAELASQAKAIKLGSYLVVKGQLESTPEREQSQELKVSQICFQSSPSHDYPLQKKKLPLEVVRNYPHLRAKTNYFLSVFRLRHSISQALHDFLDQEGFYHIPTPLITSNDSEGAGATFNLTTQDKKLFFTKPAQLTVSGQLHAEALAQGLGRVYTFAPCFRAEKSHTTRHLAEFWMVEVEIAPTDLKSLIKLTERLIKFLISTVLKKNLPELEYLENYHQKEIINPLKKVEKKEFIQLEYTQAIEILKNSKQKFVFSHLKWGIDLKAEHEKYLGQYFDNLPIFILNYPKEIKAFYMKNNPDKKTVASFDLLFPEIGELIGGSIRESDYQILKEKAQKVGDLTWYLDLRQSGYAPSGGFGLGLERLIMFLGGIENIQDTIAFPLFHHHLKF